MQVEHISDLPLLLEQITKCNIPDLIDEYFPDHGNWEGASGGKVIAGWLLYILSENDHRLSHVEDWATELLSTLRVLLGEQHLRALDFCDDRLGRLLDRLSDDADWRRFETALGRTVIDVYALNPPREGGLPVVRSDSFNAPQFRTPQELFRYGHTKHRRKDQPQCKVMVSALDPVAIPVAVEIVAGSGPDYEHYLPVIERTRHVLGRRGCLYVGDSQMGSIANRSAIHQAGDFYLTPLNRKQCTKKVLDSYLDNLPGAVEELASLEKGVDDEQSVAYFHEICHEVHHDDLSWKERRILCFSVAYGTRLQTSFDNRLKEAQESLENLVVYKRGRKNPKTLMSLNGRIAKIIAKFKVTDCFKIKTSETTESYHVNRYKDRPAEMRYRTHLHLSVERDEHQINLQRRKKGWQIYASNASVEDLPAEELVRCYRKEYRIEHLFDYTINRDVGLLPLYLKKEHRVKALIRLLLMAMRISVGVQTQVCRKLSERGEEMKGIYPGNKGRATSTPTTPMLLRAMRGISVVYLQDESGRQVMMSELSDVQINILTLLETKDAYHHLAKSLESYEKMRET